MTNVVGIEKSFPICEFPIPTLLNLLKGGVRNGGKIFNGVGLSTPPHPIAIPINMHPFLFEVSMKCTLFCNFIVGPKSIMVEIKQ